ncbi:MAG TPA: hypothetical protein PLD48_01795 [Bacillota bacterium]|nr:hypothetical protein [Bacillota bacterium]
MSGMFVIKENLPFGENYLSYTLSEDAAECFMIFTGEASDENKVKLNQILAERYGVVNSVFGIRPAYEIVRITAGRWHCPKCGVDIVQSSADLTRFSVITADGDVMGEVYRQDVADVVQTMQLLNAGGCPVCESWDDGVGNRCSSVGWGKAEFFYKNCRLITKKN